LVSCLATRFAALADEVGGDLPQITERSMPIAAAAARVAYQA